MRSWSGQKRRGVWESYRSRAMGNPNGLGLLRYKFITTHCVSSTKLNLKGPN